MLATRLDPTRTVMLRRAFGRDMIGRFVSVMQDVSKQVGQDDAVALLPHSLSWNAAREWEFQTDDKKLASFQKWLQGKIDQKILTTDAINGQPWTAKYIESAYKKGVIKAYIDSKGKKLAGAMPGFFKGSQAEFLRQAFTKPEMLSKVRLLATRAFGELQGITGAMATQLNRILANGMVQGKNPKQIAKIMVDQIHGMTKTRALMIARTEIVHAHAEGQLDSFELLGVDNVGVLAEWSTAGDDKVCEKCSEHEGKLYTITYARGKIPLHPNCRCAWIPGPEVTQREKIKKTAARAVKKAKKKGGKK